MVDARDFTLWSYVYKFSQNIENLPACLLEHAQRSFFFIKTDIFL